MKKMLKIGNYEIYFLDGGSFEIDGGAMFGVVPKVLWEKKVNISSGNNIFIVAHPILLKSDKDNIIIDTGIGNKLTEKQKKIHNIKSEWKLIESLNDIGLKCSEIDLVILTHCDYDHAGGLNRIEDGVIKVNFENARIIVQKMEWEDVKNPNRRQKHSFWEINFELIEKNLEIVDGNCEVANGIFVELSGGHNRGHQIVKIKGNGEEAIHLGDLLPTVFHYNPLWVMAYDNYPLEAIEKKEKYEQEALEKNAWFLFYHDPQIFACKFNEKGEIIEPLSRY